MTPEDSSVSLDEQLLIGRCLDAAANGEFFPDWEFATLFGLERDELRRAAAAWPRQVLDDEAHARAIRGSVSNLFHYPHGMDHQLELILGLDRGGLGRLARSLRDRY